MNNTFRTIFGLDKKTLVLLLNKLCLGKFNDLEITLKTNIKKELVDDVPKSIKISLYGTITIDSVGIHYKGEHGYQNVEIVEFNEFFNLDVFLESLEYPEDKFFINDETTGRGLSKIEFKERNGGICSIQNSSVATEDCIWFGPNDNRMHLSRDMVEKLLPILQSFVGTGSVKI